MKKYLVIGNPIEHSLSPKLHNHWIKKNNIDAIYEKKQLNEGDIEAIIDSVINIVKLIENDDITELDINPLLVMEDGHGVIAVDAFIKLN